MPPARAPATPEERAARMAAKGFPAWAREYIGQLESLTRTLAAQFQHAQAQMADQHLSPDAEAVWQSHDAAFTIRDRGGGLIVQTKTPMTIEPVSFTEIIIIITRAD